MTAGSKQEQATDRLGSDRLPSSAPNADCALEREANAAPDSLL